MKEACRDLRIGSNQNLLDCQADCNFPFFACLVSEFRELGYSSALSEVSLSKMDGAYKVALCQSIMMMEEIEVMVSENMVQMVQ